MYQDINIKIIDNNSHSIGMCALSHNILLQICSRTYSNEPNNSVWHFASEFLGIQLQNVSSNQFNHNEIFIPSVVDVTRHSLVQKPFDVTSAAEVL